MLIPNRVNQYNAKSVAQEDIIFEEASREYALHHLILWIFVSEMIRQSKQNKLLVILVC
jgi:hypothetical protein